MTITIRGWVVEIGKAPKHSPYLACGPEPHAFNDVRVNGSYLFQTRAAARVYLNGLDDRENCGIRRATVTLKVEP